ncbi:IS5 family transposase [Mesorhizobium retamae]|uniref:IS5 family transposase n=1 Tax=Mesorhizobium retamae TaxID=2912854 RepID=A0ABS9QFK0_9HYPH|nr:IS5 family transposase [Mesorhizobium sp. IRAMC:0171]MCG7505409.1 IS5 family transposase [Mesorhizobium sp. IRAMC:0171]
MPKPLKPRYRTTNWSEYNSSLKRRGSLDVWFDAEMVWLSAPCGRLGRPQRFSDTAIEFCLTMKALFGLPLRQVTGFVASLLKLAGLDWPVPDYTTLCRRQTTLPVDLGDRRSCGGLHLLVDSTGIKMMGEGEWKRRKHGASYRRQWRKVHLGIDADTLDIRAIEVTTNGTGDAPVLPDLLAQISDDERILAVGGDGAYDTRNCHAAIAARKADAVIPVRRNGRHWTKDGPGVEARNETLRATKSLGRAIWKKWSDYHRRSLAETKMSCFKRFGQCVCAKTFDRQITELKIRAKLLNCFSQIGTPITVRIS